MFLHNLEDQGRIYNGLFYISMSSSSDHMAVAVEGIAFSIMSLEMDLFYSLDYILYLD